ncbi:hypothetical protein HY501_00525 [Candidatus Woesearchaeota archaeon]|nr:hypothetical protein [Candidatus Woesearchaeota archaeon]
MTKKQTFEGIDRALHDGKILRAFRSSAGLRVVRIEDSRGGPLRGYGEHPDLMQALLHASVDYLAGGRPYEGVYGKSEPYRLWGGVSSEDRLDLWLVYGNKLWAERTNISVKVEARNFEYKPVVSAVGNDFKTAYASLCELVTDEAFEKAHLF